MQPAELALSYIQRTGQNVFLTGKAGTGKTTFLKKLRELSLKRMVVVAPTGVAAINADGVTAHSFFQLPFGPYLPSSPIPSSFNKKFSREKLNVIRSMDLLVIDEISMVRADMLDAISDILCFLRKRANPFGGLQLLLIGDLQQLAPVAKDEEWDLLKEYYPSPYFFDSKALSQTGYICVELTRVYRQNDNKFLRILNQIRNNCPDAETIRLLNERYIPNFHPCDKEGYITLTTHAYQAQQINQRKLSELSGHTVTFSAEISGEFSSLYYPTDEPLDLKIGAQVMFVKNDSSPDKRYYNGKIGRILSISPQEIVVYDDSKGDEITVHREKWSNMQYTIDPVTKRIKETEIGSFIQYPLKTAWAITIHKSQGLTFDRAIINAAQSFSHGQVYVALSRCKTLEGLVLSAPISRFALVNDNRVEQYITNGLSQRRANEERLNQDEHCYYLTLVVELFDFRPIQRLLQKTSEMIAITLANVYPVWNASFSRFRDDFCNEVTEVGERFQKQLQQLIQTSPDYLNDLCIAERINKGVSYFLEHIVPCVDFIDQAFHIDIQNKETRLTLLKSFTSLQEALAEKIAVLKVSLEGFSVSAYLTAKSVSRIPSVTSRQAPYPDSKKDSLASNSPDLSSSSQTPFPLAEDILHPGLFAALRKWRYETAAKKGFPAYTVLGQKALLGICNENPVPQTIPQLCAIHGIGKKIAASYGEEILTIIRQYLDNSSEKQTLT
ncbi:MAG: AAA family ATPase [Tannerellaceae bacterium]|jgi:hypothetical protein|nr:AAA family ATPase [Tannerellaceae bacterium]